MSRIAVARRVVRPPYVWLPLVILLSLAGALARLSSQDFPQIVQVTSFDAPLGAGNAVISRDGSMLVFPQNIESGHRQLFSVRSDGTGLQPILPSNLSVVANINPPLMSSGGTKVGFIGCAPPCTWSNAGTPGNVYVINFDGTGLMPLTADGVGSVSYGSVSISGDGTKIVYPRNIQGEGTSWFLTDTDGGSITELPLPASTQDLSLNSDGSRLALVYFEGTSRRIGVLDVGQTAVRELFDTQVSFATDLDLSDDGQVVAFGGFVSFSQSSIQILRTDGLSMPETLDSPINVSLGEVSITEDGSLVCYLRGSSPPNIFCVDTAGGAPTNVTNIATAGSNTAGPVLSANGAALTFWSTADLVPGQNSDLGPEVFVAILRPTIQPTILAVTPESGSTSGGTPVTITGTGFVDGVSVTFDDVAGTSVVFVDATTITAVTPAHAAGSVDVVVSNPDGQSDALFGAFTFFVQLPPPTILSMSPVSGPTGGGTLATVRGTGFVPGATLSFGALPAVNVIVVDSTTITGLTPPHAAGAVNVQVTNPDSQTATAANTFTYAGRLYYFALGDSVASGHGLQDDGTPCRRSPSAYPHQLLRDYRRARYDQVDFTSFACSGATVAEQKNAKDPRKWFAAQVDQLLSAIPTNTSEPVFVSVTIGANDYRFADPLELHRLLFRTSLKQFQTSIDATAASVRTALVVELARLLALPNVSVAVTEYHNPFNTRSGAFQLPGVKCLISDGSCYNRTEIAIHTLNGAILDAYSDLGQPERLQITAIHEAFHGHESAAPSCGFEVVADTWIQLATDCTHPNATGAARYSDALDLDARRLNR